MDSQAIAFQHLESNAWEAQKSAESIKIAQATYSLQAQAAWAKENFQVCEIRPAILLVVGDTRICFTPI